MEQNIIGVVYPIPRNLAEEILHKGKTVFYKFIRRVPTKNIRLKSGMKLFIYESGGLKSIIGDADITEIKYLTATELIDKYSRNMMGSETHLLSYAKGRENKSLQVLILDNILEYQKPVNFNQHMSVSGSYLYG